MKKLVELRDYQSASAGENVRHFRTENCPTCIRLRLIVVFQYLSSFSTGNNGIILKLKVLVPVNFLCHYGSRGRLGREIEGPRDT